MDDEEIEEEDSQESAVPGLGEDVSQSSSSDAPTIELQSRAGDAGDAIGTLSREDAHPPGRDRGEAPVPDRPIIPARESGAARQDEGGNYAALFAGITSRIERLENWVKTNRLT